MRHTMFLIQSLRRTKPTLSTLSQASIISNHHSISRPPPFPAAAPPLQAQTHASFFTRAGYKTPAQDPIQPNSARELARPGEQALARSYFTRERLWNLLRWSSSIPVMLAVFWYLEKRGASELNPNDKETMMKELRREKSGEMKKPNEFVASSAWEGLQTFELFHYSFYLSLFYAFSFSKTQPPKFGLLLAFWFTLISFVGLLFSRISSNLADYTALTAKAPFFYQISGAWSNHEGSLLLWCLVLTFYGFLFRRPYGKFY